jgi:hypothetical protein
MVLQSPERLRPVHAELHYVVENDRVIIANPKDKEAEAHHDPVSNIDKSALHFMVKHKEPHVCERGRTLSQPG